MINPRVRIHAYIILFGHDGGYRDYTVGRVRRPEYTDWAGRSPEFDPAIDDVPSSGRTFTVNGRAKGPSVIRIA